MIQFYVLALAFMLYGAAVLLADVYGEKMKILVRVKEIHLVNQTFTIVMIVLTGLVGLLKLIAPTPPGPVVIGDFLPAVNLLALAVFFAFDLKKNYSDGVGERAGSASHERDQSQGMNEDRGDQLFTDSDALNKVKTFYFKNKTILGYTTLGIALFHFLFPGAVLL